MATPREMFDQVLTIFKDSSPVQKVIALAVLLVVVGLLVGLTVGGGESNYNILYTGLTSEDSAEVVAKLKDLGIPYELANEGTAIKVPADQVYETRLSLAAEGLPRGGGVGFEIFDKTSLGTTDFVQRLNYQRALQGELARTIRQFQQVSEARVHIATPKESIFVEDTKEPSASISVKLRGREKLSSGQIKAIVNLVASAVPGLTSDNITVVDTAGRLLFRKEGDKESMMSATQLEYQLRLEETMRKKVETMLEEIVGVGRALARVTADVDFNRVNVTQEDYDPEGQIVRSEQLLTEEDILGSEEPQGIPGVKGKLATFSEAEDKAAQGGESHKRNNVTRNYEISKKISHIEEATGEINRLSVAVMVDGTYEKVVDKEGNTSLKYNQRTPEELRQLEKMVKNAIGYNAERGDQVEVVGMSFALSSIVEPELTGMEKWGGVLEKFTMPLVYLIIGVVFIIFVIRPFFRMMASKHTEEEAAAILAESAEGQAEEEEEDEMGFSQKKISDREKIYRLAQSDPDRAADLVRRWLREER